MRVLSVNMTLDPVRGGGTAARTVQLNETLVKLGIECSILTTRGGLTAEVLRSLQDVRITAVPSWGGRLRIPWIGWPTLLRSVRESDLVLLMNHWTALNALVYLAARREAKPYVFCPAAALPIYGRSQWAKRLYSVLIGRRIVRDADGYVATTRNEMLDFEEYGVERSAITVIPNGLPRPEVADGPGFREVFGLDERPIFLFMARLAESKRPDMLVEAFCKLRGRLDTHQLVFAGPDDGMLSTLRAAVARRGGEDRVSFVGFLGGSLKSRALRAADVLVIPSWQEVMSIVALEAGAAGTPVLLTDRCGFPEVARVGGGWEVPASVAGLERGLLEAAAQRHRRQEMGENLRRFVEENYSWDKVAGQFIELFGAVLEARARA